MQDIDLVFRAFVDNDIEVDDNGRCFIVNLVYTNDEDDPYEAKVDFDGVIEGLIEYYNNLQGYRSLFTITKELSLKDERLCECA